MSEIPVAGEVLKWAREFRGLSVEEAATLLEFSVDELDGYESGAKFPTLTKFEKFADAYKLPQATLFLRTPPEVPNPPSDFRTFEGAPPQTSFEFRVAVSNVRTLQSALHILGMEDEEFTRPILRSYNFNKNPFEQGEAERKAIAVDIDRQINWPRVNAFRHWRAIIESLGISVYLQKFSLNDCRGCSFLEDGIAPAIVINRSEQSENALIFTLIHEYAHLLIRRPGISDLRFGNPVEAFCNRFAAAFLMPMSALIKVLPAWPSGKCEWQPSTIRDAASELKVSAQALSIRLEELGKAETGFNRLFVVKSKKEQKKKTSGGSYVKTRLSDIGGRFTGSVLGALDREVIDTTHASEALGLRPVWLDEARDYIKRQRQLASG
jgi:Zn-dependent peptidase ImmA (M78 family)